ncbi:hypothetical protein G6O69_38485 [Pseudenhygromyxa sp. WMMC2535]|uniref:hypothetical protein n=1 Tax=Pseudenhygromyxa sp. WMMC2535 TaxID=2712867 RepID=UPI001595CFB9|nr:hypothetical protein [Pseudenhygromyxa sp. WMMC2535]NVB43751.1 hypothetical protein [Pseudenhygromyxa sp. WMMC2535]
MARILAMNPSLSTGEEAVPRYRRALTALGDARVDALAARLLDSRMSSRAAAPLSLRFDADSYAKIFTADDAYLSPMWLALPGLAALPTLLRELDSPRAGIRRSASRTPFRWPCFRRPETASASTSSCSRASSSATETSSRTRCARR